MVWELPRRGLADELHPDANFSRVNIPTSHDRYITGWNEGFLTGTEKVEDVV